MYGDFVFSGFFDDGFANNDKQSPYFSSVGVPGILISLGLGGYSAHLCFDEVYGIAEDRVDGTGGVFSGPLVAIGAVGGSVLVVGALAVFLLVVAAIIAFYVVRGAFMMGLLYAVFGDP